MMAQLKNHERARLLDAETKAAALRALASKPKRDVFAVYEQARAEKQDRATGSKQRAVVHGVVVALPDEPGGLRAVRRDGKTLGHAQRVPEAYRCFGEWAYKLLGQDYLEYFDSLGEIRKHVGA